MVKMKQHAKLKWAALRLIYGPFRAFDHLDAAIVRWMCPLRFGS